MRQALQERNAVVYYVLTLVTALHFAFVWVYLMNRDIQRIDASHMPSLQRWGATCLVSYGVYWSAFIYLALGAFEAIERGRAGLPIPVWPSPPVFVVGMLAAILLLWFLFRGLFAVVGYLRNTGARLPRNWVLVLLTVAYGVTLLLVQRSLNDSTTSQRSR